MAEYYNVINIEMKIYNIKIVYVIFTIFGEILFTPYTTLYSYFIILFIYTAFMIIFNIHSIGYHNMYNIIFTTISQKPFFDQ